MRITTIEIENFKCVGERQKIAIRPLTLLFGPNSSGKSTILHAIHYFREILDRNNTDPDFTVGGGQLDLGGYKALVNDHDLRKTITLKITVEITQKEKEGFLPLNSGSSFNDEEFEELQINYLAGQAQETDIELKINELGVEIEIAWDADRNIPFIAKFSTFVNGLSIASIISDSKMKCELRNINFNHPLLHSTNGTKSREPQQRDIEQSTIDLEISRLTPKLLDDHKSAEVRPLSTNQKIQLLQIGALPKLDDELNLKLVEKDDISGTEYYDSARIRGMKKLFTELLVGPARIIRQCLEQTIFVGPIREIPGRNYKAHKIVENNRWANGKGAWDMLYNDISGELINSVNSWISDEAKLGTPYKIERVNFQDLPRPHEENSEPVAGGTANSADLAQKFYDKMVLDREIVITHTKKGIILKPDDVGIGISQLLPIVISVLSNKWNLLSIEQPELHIHPALQVRLGDLFIHATNGEPEIKSDVPTENHKSLIIETHSEQILLRILRRIRETNKEKLPSDDVKLTPDKLSIIYVENRESGVKYTPLDVAKDGKFFNQWPNGFFDERMEEVF